MYNVDPKVRFWATPPYHQSLLDDPAWANGHGCLRPSVVHPANFTFKIPDHISYDEAALVEPLAVGMHSCTKAQIKPGDVAVIIGAGPIGTLPVDAVDCCSVALLLCYLRFRVLRLSACRPPHYSPTTHPFVQSADRQSCIISSPSSHTTTCSRAHARTFATITAQT